MKRLAALAPLGVLITLAAPLAAADISIHFIGLTPEMEENVRAHLMLRKDDDAYSVRRRLTSSVRDAVKPFGYYRPRIAVEPVRNSEGKVTAVNVDVDPGERIVLREPQLKLTGGLFDESEFEMVRAQIPRAGDPLLHADYESFKGSIQALALELGYFDGHFNKRSLKVSPQEGYAYWDVAYESGKRYRFGKVHFEGSQIDEAYLRSLIPFEEGDLYDYTTYGDLSRRLTDTNWFSSVVMSMPFETAKADPERILDVNVALSPKLKNLIETGIGYATDIGPHGKLSWTKPWLNASGHSLTAATDLSVEEQTVTFNYKIPSQSDPLHDYWVLQTGYEYSDINDTMSSSTSVSASRFQLLKSQWTRTVSVDWLYDNFTQGGVSDNTQIIYPTIAFSRTRQRGGVLPTWGDSRRYAVSVSNTAWSSDIDFILMTAQQSWIRSLTPKHIFIGRWSAGWIDSADFEQVPPDLRFFVGGDLSIRGYDYESVSPKNANGELEGGSKMFTASVEYQYNVTGSWWGAVFFDVGQSSHEFNFDDVKKGAGVGIRWRSPIGLLKLDVAKAVNDPEEDGWKLYFGLGSTL